MRTLIIPSVYFDSLIDWNSVEDILDTYPSLTEYQACIAAEFCKCNSLDRKSRLMFNLIHSMMTFDANLHNNQLVLLTELINSVFEDKFELINKIGELVNTNCVDWRIMLVGD